MRIIRVSIIAMMLLFTITVIWYVSQPAVIGVSRALNATYYNNTSAHNAATAIEYGSIAWGPIVDVCILLWWALSAGKKDIESEIYG